MLIRNIWCVGRNYQDHRIEMGHQALPLPKTPETLPMIFLKAGSSGSINSTEIILPWWTEEVHHEVELAVKFNAQLKIQEGALCLDLTERKFQSLAKQNREPWTLSKSFDGACAISSFFILKNLNDFQDRRLRLWVNDELKQEGRTSEMIFKIQELIDYLLERFPVCAGDLLLTGTPSGVGPIKDGDHVKAELEGEITHIWRVKKQVMPEKKEF